MQLYKHKIYNKLKLKRVFSTVYVSVCKISTSTNNKSGHLKKTIIIILMFLLKSNIHNNIPTNNSPVRVDELICYLGPYATCIDHRANTSGEAGYYR